MRSERPLSGLTPQQAVAQLVHRVLGPLQPARIRIVLDYHGLLEHPATELVEIAVGTGSRPALSPMMSPPSAPPAPGNHSPRR